MPSLLGRNEAIKPNGRQSPGVRRPQVIGSRSGAQSRYLAAIAGCFRADGVFPRNMRLFNKSSEAPAALSSERSSALARPQIWPKVGGITFDRTLKFLSFVAVAKLQLFRRASIASAARKFVKPKILLLIE